VTPIPPYSPSYEDLNICPIFFPRRAEAHSIAAASRAIAQTPSADATFTPFSRVSVRD